MPQWLIYALGGGIGHLTRAIALARAASPLPVRILSNSPYADWVRGFVPGLDLLTLPAAITAAETGKIVAHEIESAAPDCLIVDTFPRGLGGELVDIIRAFSGPKVLVGRGLKPEYAAAYDLDKFIPISYDLVLNPGDLTAAPTAMPGARTTEPWLVRSCHEVFGREKAREFLGLTEPRPAVLICAAGNREELEWYGETAAALLRSAPEIDMRCIAPSRPLQCPATFWRSHWPAIDLYAAAAVVIGGAGYNTISECLAADAPLVSRPWPRKYDRQRLRASRAATRGSVRIVASPGEAVQAALDLLAQSQHVRRPFHNGASDAARLIRSLC